MNCIKKSHRVRKGPKFRVFRVRGGGRKGVNIEVRLGARVGEGSSWGFHRNVVGQLRGAMILTSGEDVKGRRGGRGVDAVFGGCEARG